MIKDIKELNFPEYATLSQATVTLQDMAEKTITSQVKIDGQIAPDFSYDWAVEFKGEKYIMPLRQPQGAKENTSLDSVIDLTFQHWAIYQLKRRYFFSIINLEAGTILPDQYDYPISLNLKDFCTLCGKILDYYYGDSITIDFNPEWEYSDEPSTVTISNSRIWDVLTGSLLNIYGVRWQIEPRVDNNNETEGEERYVIKVGYPMPSVNHIFEYGFDGGLLKVERQVQDDTIRNMIRGRGGDKNLPYRYYKDEDPDNPTFKADPDWVPELAGIPMTQLRGATFRSYIQGWNHKHYKRTSVTSADKAYAPWAWMRGYTDTRINSATGKVEPHFNPVEFVADEFDISLNGYGVVKDSSISRYGELEGALSDNEDIYPTIQGVLSGDHLNFFGEDFGRVDQIVAVDIPEDTGAQPPEESVTENLKDVEGTVTGVAAAAYKEITIRSQEVFYIETGKSGDLFLSSEIISVNGSNDTLEISKTAGITQTDYVAVNVITGERHSASGIPEGTWRFEVTLKVHNQLTSGNGITVKVRTKNVRLVKSSVTDAADAGWYVWIKNIWGSSKNTSETDKEYAERVWLPILGDHIGKEASLAFSTGLLSTSEDYTFKILSIPEHDESRILNGAKSHWRLRLGKSDADYDVTGKLIPDAMRPAYAGEYFFFTGIELPSAYWIWAEERLDNWKKDELEKLKDIRPAWAVTPDKVRLANNGYEGALIDMVKVGSSITIADKRFISGSQQEILYVQNIIYTYNEPTDTEANIIPDISFELSDRYEVVADPTSEMQGEISALQKQIGNLSNVKQSVRKIGDKVYLCKDRKDRTPYDLGVGGMLGAEGGARFGSFVSGMSGAQVDRRGNAEFESVIVRSFMQIYELIVNRQRTLEGDVFITEGDTIEEVIPLGTSDEGNALYTLKLHPEWEGYTTAQYEGNVIRGVYNNITQHVPDGDGTGQTTVNNATYATSWMRVLAVRPTDNEVDVVMYPDAEVPAGRNFPPRAMMKFARWGNAGGTEEQQRRQTVLYFSSTEGRIMKRFRVTKPIVGLENVSVCIGTLPEGLYEASGNPILKDVESGGYFETLVVQNLIQLDHQGLPKPEITFRGDYDPDADYYDGTAPRPDTGVYEWSCVVYYGCQWLCLKPGTKNPPSWDSIDWMLYLGDPRLLLEWVSDDDMVDEANPEITVTLAASISYQDVTDDPKLRWDWARETWFDGVQDTAGDELWNRAHYAWSGRNSIDLRREDLNCMSRKPEKMIIIVTATLVDSAGRTKSFDYGKIPVYL